MTMVPNPDAAGNGGDIARMVELVLVPGAVAEVRALGVGRPPLTYAGWFDDAGKMVSAIAEGVQRNPRGIYVTLNPVRRELIARRANRLAVADRDLSLTSDGDILRRRWLPLDFDPERPSGICSTDAEHERALSRAEEAEAWLSGHGWPPPVRGDSGNGAHRLYRIDLPNDGHSRQLVEAALQAMASRFGGDGITLDAKVFNAARIWRTYGTINAKGDNTADRPHRLARLVQVPDELIPVTQVQLEALASAAAQPLESPSKARGRGQPFDVDAFLSRYGLTASKSPWQDGTRWALERCPMSDAHTDGAYVVQRANGAIVAGCHHDSCTWGWRELREKFEPTAGAPAPATRPDRGGGRRKRSDQEPRILGPITLRLSEVTAKPIAWVWRGRLALGELTIMIGDPGEGKGLISVNLSARITRGEPLPGDPEEPGEPATVVVLSGEDNPETVLRPRYEAAGAVLKRVVLVPGKLVLHQGKGEGEPGEKREEPIFLTDLEPLHKVLAEHAPRLLVIDPLQQYLDPETDSRRANQTRPILESLMKLAREFDVAVLALYHMNKDSGQTKAMYRALDSIDIAAAARLMLLVGHQPDDETKRAVVAVKSNLSRKPEALGFAIDAESDEAVPTIAWTGPTDLTQETLLGGGRSSTSKNPKVDEAVTWLLDLLRPLAEAGMPPDEVEAAGKEFGITKRTLERAKRQAGVISRRRTKNEGEGWVWTLWTHCWSCHTELCVETHERCPVCGWLRCACGQCEKGCEGADQGADGRCRRQDRQGTNKPSNTPGNVAVLVVDHEAQGLSTPPSEMMNGGVAGDGGEAPCQVPLPGIKEHAQANPTVAEDGSSAHPLRQAESTPPFTKEVGGVATPWAPTLTSKAAKLRRQLGTPTDAGDVGLAAGGLPPAEVTSPTTDGDDLNEVTI